MGELRTPQVRVLQALVDGALEGRQCLSRQELGALAGWTGISGTLTRALNGLREGSSSGAAHPGLLALGLVEAVELDLDGGKEIVYRATETGVEALGRSSLKPTMRDKAASINHRYKEQADAQGDR